MNEFTKKVVPSAIIALIVVAILSAIVALIYDQTFQVALQRVLLVLFIAAAIIAYMVCEQNKKNNKRLQALADNIYEDTYNQAYCALQSGSWGANMYQVRSVEDLPSPYSFNVNTSELKIQLCMMTTTRKALSYSDRILLQQTINADLKNSLNGYGAQIKRLKVGPPKTIQQREVVLIEVQL